ncbi:MAG: PqqD family protein [Candidatus Omnitrophica bacterium]|nr:PqqD family protein [Candidatus Omnitrophota bacterium]
MFLQNKLKRCFQKNEDIIEEEKDRIITLFDPYRRVAIRLSPTGYRIWQLIDGRRQVSDIIEELKKDFEVNEKTICRDVICFLDKLAKREIIK